MSEIRVFCCGVDVSDRPGNCRAVNVDRNNFTPELGLNLRGFMPHL